METAATTPQMWLLDHQFFMEEMKRRKKKKKKSSMMREASKHKRNIPSRWNSSSGISVRKSWQTKPWIERTKKSRYIKVHSAIWRAGSKYLAQFLSLEWYPSTGQSGPTTPHLGITDIIPPCLSYIWVSGYLYHIPKPVLLSRIASYRRRVLGFW